MLVKNVLVSPFGFGIGKGGHSNERVLGFSSIQTNFNLICLYSSSSDQDFLQALYRNAKPNDGKLYFY